MPSPDPLLTELDRDQTLESGRLFLDLIARYLGESSLGETPVSTRFSTEELAARFDEPLPQSGKPLQEVLARIEREIIPEVTRLVHPMYMGHQVSAPLPASIWVEALI